MIIAEYDSFPYVQRGCKMYDILYSKIRFSAVHMKTKLRRFHKSPLWHPFSKSCTRKHRDMCREG